MTGPVKPHYLAEGRESGPQTGSMQKPDEKLVLEARDGHMGAYEELVRRWAPRVLAFCRSRVSNLHVAEDLAQEALLRGHSALGTLSRPASFGAWLRGIALRVCLDWFRSRKRSEVPLGDSADRLDDPAAPADADVEHRDQLAALGRAVDTLPEEFREVVMLYYTDDLTYRELSAMLGVSAATINARLTRARALLREKLGAGG